jgi:hypothetical protein
VLPPAVCIALSGLRRAIDRCLGEPFGRPELPPEAVWRLRSLQPEVSRGASGVLTDPAYHVTLVAPMKAGKSTLLNAMLGQDLLPSRGPAMTVLPTRVVVEAAAHQDAPAPERTDARPTVTLTHDQDYRLSQLGARLAESRHRDAVAAALGPYPLLEEISDEVRRWPGAAWGWPVSGRAAVRHRVALVNDLLRLALVALPGDEVLDEVRAIGAVRVHAPLPWLHAASNGARLVLTDTPGPNEELRPGVLNDLVADEVHDAHELLVIADATARHNEAEKAVRELIDAAVPWPGYASELTVVNRADMVRELRSALSGNRASGGGRDGEPAITAARHGLAAAIVLEPPFAQADADAHRAGQEFLRLIRPMDWEEAPSDPKWLRKRAQETWQWSGVAGLRGTFLAPRAREPSRFILGSLLSRVAAAIPPDLGDEVRARLANVAKAAET